VRSTSACCLARRLHHSCWPLLVCWRVGSPAMPRSSKLDLRIPSTVACSTGMALSMRSMPEVSYGLKSGRWTYMWASVDVKREASSMISFTSFRSSERSGPSGPYMSRSNLSSLNDVNWAISSGL